MLALRRTLIYDGHTCPLEDELTLYCIDGGLAVSADFHIGQGSQIQGRDPDLGREDPLMVCNQRVLFRCPGI